ncbi:uncharacterized protein TNCV_5075731 [Trichonephila clavipes]|uniref:Transposase n=1 Tax=Trichonephila clavipes TaxID=2585209 RepID=A0A8X6RV00_TRICX|nr:uncharacterized protein TNCV_5075731 [Trichonephila clavipes]
MKSTVKFYEWKEGQNDPEKKTLFRRKLREACVNLTSKLILLASCAHADKTKSEDKKDLETRFENASTMIKGYDLPSAIELLKSCKDFFKDLRSDTAFNEMLCDALELANETDIPANFELPKPLHRVRIKPGFCSKSRYNFKDITASPNKCGKWRERSSSKLKLIEKFLRSTTTEDRLNGLTTIAIEHELAEEINVKEIIKKKISELKSDIRNENYEVVENDSNLEPLESEIMDLEDDCEDIQNFRENVDSQRSPCSETLPTPEPKNTTMLNLNSECFQPKQIIPYVEPFENERGEFVGHAHQGHSTVVLSTALPIDDGDKYPLAADVIMSDVYMNDLLTGTYDLESGRKLQEQLISMLKGAGMELHKWSASNPLQLSDSMCQEKDLFYSSSTETKTLGLLSKPHPDSFAFKISPMTLKLRQSQNALESINCLEIPHYCLQDKSIRTELHGFSDSSEKIYGAALYLRCVNTSGQISVRLLCSKSKYDQARRRFVEWAQNEIAVVPDFHKRILFSDEAHFWLNGYVNKQNCRIWSKANPQVYVETPLHPEKLTVWCALWAGGIIGPYFFKNNEGHNVTVNGDRYRAMR